MGKPSAPGVCAGSRSTRRFSTPRSSSPWSQTRIHRHHRGYRTGQRAPHLGLHMTAHRATPPTGLLINHFKSFLTAPSESEMPDDTTLERTASNWPTSQRRARRHDGSIQRPGILLSEPPGCFSTRHWGIGWKASGRSDNKEGATSKARSARPSCRPSSQCSTTVGGPSWMACHSTPLRLRRRGRGFVPGSLVEPRVLRTTSRAHSVKGSARIQRPRPRRGHARSLDGMPAPS